MKKKLFKIVLKFLSIKDILFSEKFILKTFKNDIETNTTNYDSREF